MAAPHALLSAVAEFLIDNHLEHAAREVYASAQSYFDWGHFSTCVREDLRSAQHYLSRYIAWVTDCDCAIALGKLQGELDDFARRDARRVRIGSTLTNSKGEQDDEAAAHKRSEWLERWHGVLCELLPLTRSPSTVKLLDVYKRFMSGVSAGGGGGGSSDFQSSMVSKELDSSDSPEDRSTAAPPSVQPPSISPPRRQPAPSALRSHHGHDHKANGKLKLSREVTQLYLPFFREGEPGAPRPPDEAPRKKAGARPPKRSKGAPTSGTALPSTVSMHNATYSNGTCSSSHAVRLPVPTRPSVAPPSKVARMTCVNSTTPRSTRCLSLLLSRTDDLSALFFDGRLTTPLYSSIICTSEPIGMVLVAYNWLVIADTHQLYVVSATNGQPMVTKKLERPASVIAAESRETSFFYLGTEDGYLLQFELIISLLTEDCSEMWVMNDSKPGRTTLNGQYTATPAVKFCMMRFLSATDILVVTSSFTKRFSVKSSYDFTSLPPRHGIEYTAAQLSADKSMIALCKSDATVCVGKTSDLSLVCCSTEPLEKSAHGTAIAMPTSGSIPKLVVGGADGSTHVFIWEN